MDTPGHHEVLEEIIMLGRLGRDAYGHGTV